MEYNLVDLAATQLQATGGRMTHQRRLILQTLAECNDHPTAEEIFARARDRSPGLNLSTVYRTLRWLEQEGLVNTRLFEDERRQERFDPVAEVGQDHYHFRCRACNQIIEFPAPLIETIKAQYSAQYGGSVETATLMLYGLCADCAGSQP